MLHKIGKLAALTPPERAMLAWALWRLPLEVLAVRAGARLLAVPLARTRPAATTPAPGRIAQLVDIATRHGLVRGNCLSRSRTLLRLLRRHGIHAELRIGARRVPAGLEAHAWVECEGRPLNDTADVAERFVPFPALPGRVTRLV